MELSVQAITGTTTAANTTSTPSTASKPWRCRSCAALLGMVHGDELHVKYKDDEQWIQGTCRRPCRRCRTMNILTVGAAAKRAA